MDPRRIVVGTSRANVHEASQAPLVGLLPWKTPDEGTCSIIIKARVARGAPDRILRPETFFARPAQAEPLLRPVDFVPIKTTIDILVTGHITLPGPGRDDGEPLRMSGTLSAGGITTALDFEAAQPGRIPLTLPHARIRARERGGGALGPVNLHDEALERVAADQGAQPQHFYYNDDFPFEVYQCASRPQHWDDKPDESSHIVLELLVKGKPETILDIEMPPVSPRVIVDPSLAGADAVKLNAHLDTVLVDVDKAELELTWRAYLPVMGGVRDIDRVLIGWASDEAMESRAGWRSILRELPHGRFEHAWFLKDADTGVPPERLTAHEEKIARYQTWTYVLGPEPRLSLEEFAEVSEELDEDDEDDDVDVDDVDDVDEVDEESVPRAPRRLAETREAILARHGLDEASYALEERAWLERATAETRQYCGESPTSDKLIVARDQARERLNRQLTSGKEEP